MREGMMYSRSPSDSTAGATIERIGHMLGLMKIHFTRSVDRQ